MVSPDVSQLFPFPLDGFQLESIDALNQGHSVVVSAPTGSGKTLVGEYAIIGRSPMAKRCFTQHLSRPYPIKSCAIFVNSLERKMLA